MYEKMDKNTLETYELLPANNIGSDKTRFFVMQNDGNFQILTKPIQYVTQEQTNIKEQDEAHSSAVYNLESQPFYVNVDNSAELISVTGDFILPPTDNNAYATSYLLQSGITTNTQEATMEDTLLNNLQPQAENLPIPTVDTEANENNKQSADDCAEVTISDEQYQILEQKGWILLESNDKIFVLNTQGLHDITSNDKLLQKLKNESNNFTDTDSCSIGSTENFLNINHNEFFNQYDTTFNIVNDNVKLEADNIETSNSAGSIEDNYENVQFVSEQEKVDTITNLNNVIPDHTVEVTKNPNGCAYKIKTNIVFKDIPNKIILGRTANGKRLVAKVVNTMKPMTISEKIVQNQKLSGTDLSNSQFIGLLKHTLLSNGNTYSTEDISAAETVVVQLFKVPALRQSIVGENLIVTKIRNIKEPSGKLKRKLTLVMGKVKVLDNNQGSFIHFPNLLQYLIMKSERMDTTNESESVPQKDDITIFHVHESESLCEDNSLRVDINLTKRQIAIDSIVDRPLLKTYACGACAAIFNSAEELKEHQESLCLEMGNNLTIDTDNMNPNKDTFATVENGKKKFFCCLQCNARFTKHSHCQKHVKTHFLPACPQKSENKKTTAGKPQLYKCKMCPATFFVTSTLSKHILTKHIKLKKK